MTKKETVGTAAETSDCVLEVYGATSLVQHALPTVRELLA